MKSYKLIFVYGYSLYAITTRDDSLVSAIKRELKTGALLAYIEEVK